MNVLTKNPQANAEKHPSVQLIELDCVYQQLEDPEIRKLFSNLLLMRKRGYSTRHGQGSLPIDTYDFIGTHYLMVQNLPEGKRVLGGVRMVSLSRSLIYHMPFPAMSLLNAAKATRHIDFMNRLFQEYGRPESNAIDFTYVSSWTFDPISREDASLTSYLHDLFCVANVLSHADPTREIRVACGIPRLKTDRYITNIIGYERSSDADGPLPEVQQSNLVDEPVVLLHLKNGHPFSYRRRAQMLQKIWDERLVLTPKEVTERKKAA